MFNGNGKYYWDNKKYNEATLRIGGGLGYQTASVEVSLIPFKKNAGMQAVALERI